MNLDGKGPRARTCECCSRPINAAEHEVDGDEVEDFFEEESETMRMPRNPSLPCAADIEEHRRTHYPFRTWCRECLMGRGLGEQRGAHAGRPHSIPIVGVDFWYITSGTIKRRDELEYPLDANGDNQLNEARKRGDLVKCLIVRCYATKCVFAHVIPFKGRDEDPYIVDLVCTDVAWLGHVKLILKGDNEKALASLITRALKSLKCNVENLENVMPENSQEYDSQANGGTEVGIRNVRGFFRTLKFCLERRIGYSIPAKHPITAWLIEHAAHLITVCAKGPDGMTPWQRARGRPFGLKAYGFLECVMWKPPLKGPQHDVEGNMGPRLFPGIFIGYHKGSNSYRVITETGDVTKSRALQSVAFEERWDVDRIKAIKTTPWSLRILTAPEAVEMGEPVEKHPKPIEDVVANPRRLKITMKTLQDHNFTKDCQQCDHVRTFGEAKPGLAHSETCRQRIMEAMAQTPEGQARLEAYESRVTRSGEVRTETAPAPGGTPKAATASSSTAGNGDSAQLPQAHEASATMREQQGPLARDDYSAAAAQPPSTQLDDDQLPPAADAVGQGTADDADVGMDDANENGDADMAGAVECECLLLVEQLGVDTGSYRRERKKAMRRLVAEVYSPPRVTKLLSKLKGHPLAAGFALDITCIDPDDGLPWDFDSPAKRAKALDIIRRTKPLFLIGSPMCTAWSTWQRLNAQRRDPAVVKKELVRARLHLDFVVSLYHEQMAGGRFFLHEQPACAASWQEAAVKELGCVPGVNVITADQCQLGAEVQFGTRRGEPIRKATGFMSNAEKLLEQLHKRCHSNNGQCTRKKGGRHVTVQGRITADSAVYPQKLCKAIIKGMTAQLLYNGMVKPGEIGIFALDDDGDVETKIRSAEHGYSGKYRDGISGQLLRDDLVHEARRKELEYFCSKGVWIKKPKHEARQQTGRGPISVRWVDVNKGDDMNPRYRSRLVARQLKAHDRSGASFFAPTPPLEALRTILSMATTKIKDWQPIWDPSSPRRMQLSFIDITRAYFNAKLNADENTYVQLPEEDADHSTSCAKLLRHMYGTRAAADGWQEEYSTFLVEHLGFIQGRSSPCVFRHPTKQLMVSVHGDDFTAAGAKNDLDWYEAGMQENYECTVQPRVGPGRDDAKEAVVLNRIVRWTTNGVEYEADPRQAEKLVAECGLTGANTVATPGLRVSKEDAQNDKPLEPHLHTAFRGAAARANYLAADRIDCQFAAKEVCRWMASPTESAWTALKRLCRYLVGLPRMVYVYDYQSADTVEAYTDTDWAGRPRTRKSTSGGCVLLGNHTIKIWSSTQASIALSSGEAEFNGVVRASGVGLGYQSLLRDLGQELPVRVWTDSSAAIGICSRQGLGKLRHLDCHTLWVQQAVRSRRIDLRKVPGELNPADILTKHAISRDRLIKLTDIFECKFRGGRAASAPLTRKTTGTKTTMAEANAVEDIEDAEGVSSVGETAMNPLMPHKLYDRVQLRNLYPPLEVPEDTDNEAPDDENDDLLTEGARVVKEIIREAEELGRRRSGTLATTP